jgi:hypothetical protein
LKWYAGNHDYFSNASFQQRKIHGQIEALRYLGVPDWFIRFVLKARAARRWVYRFAGRVRWQA